MPKRDWNAIVTNHLAEQVQHQTPLAAQQQPQPPAAKRQCYNFDRNDIVAKRTNTFIHSHLQDKSMNIATDKSFYLRNHITNKDVRVCRNHDLTIGRLETEFLKTGHCIAYKITEAYVTNLMLDFDCYKCKASNCDAEMEYEMLAIVHDELLERVRNMLQCQNVQCVIFKRPSACSLHVYFDVSVSIVVIELMRKRLMTELSENITHKYLIDDISMLDLPFSTKNGHSIYLPVYHTNNFDFKKMSCLPFDQFYDVDLKLNVDEVLHSYVTLGKFKSIHSTGWNDDVEHIKYLLTPLNFNPKLNKTDNMLARTIKIGHIKHFSSDYNILHEYFTSKDSVVLEEQFSPSEFTENETKVLKQLKKLDVIVAKKVYKVTTNGESLKHIVKFITTHDGDYSFYVVCSLIVYIASLNTSSMEIEMSLKKTVIKILRLLFMNNGTTKNELIIHSLNCIDKFDCMQNMNEAFHDFNKWFKYLFQIAIMNEFKCKSKTDKYLRFITTRLKVYENVDAVYVDLVELLSMLMPVILMEHEGVKVHYYIDVGIYVSVAMEKFFSNSSIQVQNIDHILKKTLQLLRENDQITSETLDKIKIKDVWYKYLYQLPVTHPKFNFYDYFISTEIGVFNTLTGLYMAHTPLIFMNTQKKYCVTPHVVINNMSLQEINSHIMNENQSRMYYDILNILLNEQQKIFYGAVMIPGLLTMRDVLFHEQQEQDMCSLIYRMIINDDDVVNEKLLYFIEPVICKYNLDIASILNLSDVIVENIQMYGIYNREDVSNVYKQKTRHFEQYQFMQKHDMTLYDQLSDERPANFKPKFFTLAVVLMVFEITMQDNSNNQYLQDFVSKRVAVPQITVPEYHMFKDVAKYSLSLKSFDNMKRVVEYLTCTTVPSALLNLVRTISTMLNRDIVSIKDFFSAFSLIYNHTSKRKKLVLLIGSPNSGKSTYQNMLMEMHGKSSFSMTSVVQGDGHGPTPEMITALGRYCFSVVELKSMNISSLKSIISGNDATHRRFLFQNTMNEVKPLSFAIAASNAIPIIHHADEAVRDRLAPFLIGVTFVDRDNIDNIIDDNTLLGEVGNFMVSTTQFQIQPISKEFSNLIYEYFQQNRDDFGLMQCKLSNDNHQSHDLINQILIKNNIIYYILDASGIKFGSNYSITYTQLEEEVTPQIELYKRTRTTKPYDFRIFKKELTLLLKSKEFPDKSGIRGIGLPNAKADETQVIANALLVKNPTGEVKLMKIRATLYHKMKLSIDKINSIMEKVRIKYASNLDDDRSCIKGYVLSNV
nr:helicase [Menippe mercenaria nudivirus]